VPVYDFRCRQCGEVSEVFLRSTEARTVSCPGCGSVSMEKLISASYLVKMGAAPHGKTCCGREERCEMPPCSSNGGCCRS